MATKQQLRAEARQIGNNIADLTATCVRMGEKSEWRDARIPQIEREIERLQAVRFDILRQARRDGCACAGWPLRSLRFR